MEQNKIDYLYSKYGYIFKDPSIFKTKELHFLQILANCFHFKPIACEELIYRAEQVWPQRQSIFGTNTSYKVIAYGLALSVADEFDVNNVDNVSEDISSVIGHTPGGNPRKNVIAVYRVYELAKDMFNTHK